MAALGASPSAPMDISEPPPPEPPVDPQRAANRARFEIELEFVQALSSPYYLETLAQRGYFEQETFVSYLKYLMYWKKREYVRFIAFPQALHHLELLQHDSFRKALSNHDVVVAIENRQYQHWRIWRNNPAMQPRLSAMPPVLPKVSVTSAEVAPKPGPTAAGDPPPPVTSSAAVTSSPPLPPPPAAT